jgi:hypothetical protein
MTEAVEHPKSAQISSYLASNKRREFGPVGNVTLHSLQNAGSMMQVLPNNIDWRICPRFEIRHIG